MRLKRRSSRCGSDVLNCTGIGIDDNFFDLGGHSMLAATMLLRAERTLGRRTRPGRAV
jgi:enterobactin synthetase component F